MPFQIPEQVSLAVEQDPAMIAFLDDEASWMLLFAASIPAGLFIGYLAFDSVRVWLRKRRGY